MDPGEESFTLSSFDFSSSFGLYTSDDDDDNDNVTRYEQQLDQRNEDDIDAYIELELPPPPSRSDGGDGNKELELRISFSAVVPFPGFFPNSAKPSFSTSQDANAQLTAAAVDSTPQLSCINGRSSNHSTISFFPLAWKRSPPPVDDDYSHINGWDLVRSRKASPAVDEGITKLLVKLRSIIISGFGSMRASLAQAGIASNQAQKRCPESQRLTSMKPFERWLTLCKPREPPQRVAAVRTNFGSSSSEVRSTSKVTEIKFEAMRTLFGHAISPMKNNGSKSNRMNKSCPTSVKSSPVHQSGDASLVHAAIAHCKKSFGQNDDFSF